MLISNPDLISSCRVCRNPNQDGDYECLYDLSGAAPVTCSVGLLPPLNQNGKLYENLFGKITPETYEYYPRYLCNSCDLQMRLFRKLKDKALNTIKYLGKLYDEDFLAYREEQKIIIEDEELVEEEGTMIGELADASEQNGQEGGNYVVPQTEINAAEVLAGTVYILPDVMHHTKRKLHHHTDLEETLQIQLPEELLEKDTELLEVADLQNCPGLDKSDYVLEIYKVLEDGTQTAVSETGMETDEARDNDVDNYVIEEGSQFAYSDEQYVDVDSYVTAEKCDVDYRPAKRRRTTKTGLTIEDKMKVYKCTECSEIFTCTKEYKHHRIYIHAQTYTCTICSTVLKSPRNLTAHMKIHADAPAFQCDLCPRTFTQKVHYQYHMNRHNNIRNFKCDQCEKSFISKTDLKVHIRQHSGERPHVCEICGKGYMLAEHLRTHALKHTDIQFPCDLCPQKFATPKTLRQHVSSIHTAEPRFKCEYCLKPFRRKHHLQYHMKLHPKNVLADPNYSIVDENKPAEDVDDDLEVDSPAEMAADEPQEEEEEEEEEDQDDFIKDPGFVAINEQTILM